MDTELDIDQAMIVAWFRSLPKRWHAERPHRGGLHVSSLTASEREWCCREQVLAQLHPQRVQTPNIYWQTAAIFAQGWSFHERWQKWISDYGKVVEVEQSHYDANTDIYFTPDAIMRFGPHEYVIEFKGWKDDNCKPLSEDYPPPHEVTQQLMLYMHLLGIERGIILIENKNNQSFYVWVVDYDYDIVKPLLRRAQDVREAVTLARATGALPLRICETSEDARAKRCPLRDVCFGMECEPEK